MKTIQPRIRTQQPPYPARINSGLFGNPVVVVNPVNGGYIDGNDSATFGGTLPSRSLNYYGRSLKYAMASTQVMTRTLEPMTAVYSFMAVVDTTGTDANYSSVFSVHSATDGVIQLRHTTTTWSFFHETIGGFVSATATHALGRQVLCGTWDGANIRIYLNGVLANTTVATSLIVLAVIGINVGSDFSFGNPVAGSYFDGHINHLSFHPGIVWTNAQIAELGVDPWKIYSAAPPRRILVGVPGGAATHTLNVSLDSIFQKQQSLLAQSDALLVRINNLETMLADALLTKRTTDTASVDALLMALKADTVGVDALLQKLTALNIGVDAILQLAGVNLEFVNIDALLQKMQNVSTNIDAMLQSISSMSSSVDAILTTASVLVWTPINPAASAWSAISANTTSWH